MIKNIKRMILNFYDKSYFILFLGVFLTVFNIFLLICVSCCEGSMYYDNATNHNEGASLTVFQDDPSVGLWRWTSWFGDSEYGDFTEAGGPYNSFDLAYSGLMASTAGDWQQWLFPNLVPPVGDPPPPIDNTTQFQQLMDSFDNTAVSLQNISYQADLLLGVLFAAVFITAYRWHL